MRTTEFHLISMLGMKPDQKISVSRKAREQTPQLHHIFKMFTCKIDSTLILQTKIQKNNHHEKKFIIYKKILTS